MKKANLALRALCLLIALACRPAFALAEEEAAGYSMKLSFLLEELPMGQAHFLGAFTVLPGCDITYTVAGEGGPGLCIGFTDSMDRNILSRNGTNYLASYNTEGDTISGHFYAQNLADWEMAGQTLYLWVGAMEGDFTAITGAFEMAPAAQK